MLTVVLLLFSFAGYCRDRAVYGTVRSEDGRPVDLCVVKAGNENISTNSNEHGDFYLVYNADVTGSLIFTAWAMKQKR
jgi:hypothetical protein